MLKEMRLDSAFSLGLSLIDWKIDSSGVSRMFLGVEKVVLGLVNAIRFC